MSRPRYYWYGLVKKLIYRYYSLKDYKSLQEFLFYQAINATLREFDSMTYPTERYWVIEQVLFKQRLTVDGAAQDLCFSSATVNRWINDFVKKVGKNAGFA